MTGISISVWSRSGKVGMCDVDGNTSYSVLSSRVNLDEAHFVVNVWLQVCACYYDECD